MTRAATQILGQAWEKKMADKSGPDYAAFRNGWWELTNNLQRMHESVRAAKKP